MNLSRSFCAIAVLASIPMSAQVFSGSSGGVPDDGTPTDFTALVSGLAPNALDNTHGLLSVCFDITHTYTSDLYAQLIAPDGTSVQLFGGVGGGGDDFQGTCVTDTALTSIAMVDAPFTGSYRPMDHLGNINNGAVGNGTWILRIVDAAAQDVGTLNSWSLTFGVHATAPITVDSTNLPLIIINTNGQQIVDEPKVEAHMSIIDNGPGQMNHLTDAPNGYDGRIGIELRGNFSAGLPQKPYGLSTWDDADANLDVALLGMPEEHDWILLANYNDKTFMRNSLAFDLSRDMGHYAPRTRLCEVMLNGQYQGIYVFTEKIKRDAGRVDIATLNTDENTGDDLTGGYIIKDDYYDGSNSWQSNHSPIDHPGADVHYVYQTPAPDVITEQQKGYIQGFMASLEGALYSPQFADTAQGYRAFLDVGSFIDYFLVNELSRNIDGFRKSYFMYKDKESNGGSLKSGPVWDFDWAWKDIPGCDEFNSTEGAGWAYLINDCSPDVNSPGWAVRLLQDTSFANELNCRYTSLRSSVLDTAYLFNYIDSVHTLVNDAQVRHFQKWPILGINVGTPEVGAQAVDFAEEMLFFKQWIARRLLWLDANMPGHCTSTVISENTLDGIRLFPNPSSAWVFIESATPIASVEVASATGQHMLAAMNAGATRATLNTSSLSEGTYIVTVRLVNGRMLHERVMVQRP